MGLDMYLTEEKYIGKFLHKKAKDGGCIATPTKDCKITVTRIFEKDGKDKKNIVRFKPDLDISGARIVLPVFYWRKANAIHKYFVDKCGDGEDDCKPIYVSYDDLIELRDRCRLVLKDHSRASELLPTCEGFFFGSTEYDEYYFQDLKETADMIDKINLDDDTGDFYYRASW